VFGGGGGVFSFVLGARGKRWPFFSFVVQRSSRILAFRGPPLTFLPPPLYQHSTYFVVSLSQVCFQERLCEYPRQRLGTLTWLFVSHEALQYLVEGSAASCAARVYETVLCMVFLCSKLFPPVIGPPLH